MLPQAYPCLCAYYGIYKLGRFSFYLLVPRHTSAYSLLANAMLMCRFAPPLAFNFMAGIALPPAKSYSPGRDVTETVRAPPSLLHQQMSFISAFLLELNGSASSSAAAACPVLSQACAVFSFHESVPSALPWPLTCCGLPTGCSQYVGGAAPF